MQGNTLDAQPDHRRPKKTLTREFVESNSPVSHCLWIMEESGVSGGNPHQHGENKLDTECPADSKGTQIWGPSCEMTVQLSQEPESQKFKSLDHNPPAIK